MHNPRIQADVKQAHHHKQKICQNTPLVQDPVGSTKFFKTEGTQLFVPEGTPPC